jgi:hypothetical protein
MTGTSTVIAVHNLRRSMPTARANAPESVDPNELQPAADARGRRFSWATIGFFLGGLVLGTAGCILGTGMPYRHPVAVTMSILWWGLYLGCAGASFVALIGLWMDRASGLPASADESTYAIRKWPRYVPMPIEPTVRSNRAG